MHPRPRNKGSRAPRLQTPTDRQGCYDPATLLRFSWPRCAAVAQPKRHLTSHTYLADRYLIPFLIATFSQASHGSCRCFVSCDIPAQWSRAFAVINRGLDFSAPIPTTGADDRYSSGTRRNLKARSSRQRSSSWKFNYMGLPRSIPSTLHTKLFRMMF